jgi:hypothetical protein
MTAALVAVALAELGDITVKILAMMAVLDCCLIFRELQHFMPAAVADSVEILQDMPLHKVQAVR